MDSNKLDQAIESIHLTISYLLRMSLIIAGFWGIFIGRVDVMFFCLLTLLLSFIPAFIEHNYKLMLPAEFEFAFVFFIYGSMFLGEIYDYYDKFWWWDIFLHSISSILAGIIGFIIVYILYSKNVVKTNPFLAVLFAFSFSVALGAMWEIFEYGMDTFFGLNMLKEGLVDTMQDLMVNCVGAFIVSTLGYWYLRYEKAPLLENLIRQIIRDNPHMFDDK